MSANLSRKWISNSSQGTSSVNPFATIVSAKLFYATGLVSVIVILHGVFLHGRKYDSVRVCTDIGAITCAFSALFAYIVENNPTEINNAVLSNLMCNGILTAILQLCDCFLFYSRYLAIEKVTYWWRITIHAYIWLFLIWTWLITFTFAPFIADTNSLSYVYYSSVLMNIYVGGDLCFNLFITMRCSLFLYKFLVQKGHRKKIQPLAGLEMISLESGSATAANVVFQAGNNLVENPQHRATTAATTSVAPVLLTADLKSICPAERLTTSQHAINNDVVDVTDDASNLVDANTTSHEPAVQRRLKIIAIKSIGHGLTSSMAALLSAYEPTGVGYAIWSLLILLGMHLWFNWRLEKYFCPPPINSHMMNRLERELHVMLDARQRQGGINVEEGV